MPSEDQQDPALPSDDVVGEAGARRDPLVEELGRLEHELADRVAHWSREAGALEAQVRHLETQLEEAQDAAQAGASDVQRLSSLLAALRREHHLLLTSRRWKMGNRIGAVLERLARKQGAEKATVRIDRLYAQLDAWREQAAPSLAGPAGEDAATHRFGISADLDAAHREELYRRHVADVEEPPPPQSATPSVRAVVIGSWGTPDHGGARSVGIATSVAACQTDGLAVTVVGSDAQSPPGADLAPSVSQAAAAAGEEYLLLLAPGDIASPHLGDGIGAAAGERPAAILVDDDRLTPDGTRSDARLKPGFQPDRLLEHDYVGNGALLSAAAVRELGGVTAEDRNLVRDLLLRMYDEGLAIAKVDRVLLHRSRTAAELTAVTDDDVAFVERTLERRGLRERAAVVRGPHGLRVRYRPQGDPLVSIIIPFKDKADLLRDCVASIFRLTTYPAYEVLLVDNDSQEQETAEYLAEVARDPRVRVLSDPRPFNYSRVNNDAAREAQGEILVFLNNDTKLLSESWLDDLVAWSQVPGVASVGAVLHFGDGRIQHAGVAVGVRGFASHVFAGAHETFLRPDDLRHVRNASAVTGACCAIRRDLFSDLGGFDEEFVLTGSDVELGLRALRRGYRNVVAPDVRLLHYEKQSRSHIPVNPIDIRRSVLTYQPYLREGDPFWNTACSSQSTLLLPRTEPEPSYEGFLKQVTEQFEARELPGGDTRPSRFLARYDASEDEVAENARVLASRPARPLPLNAVAWFLPNFDHAYRGGVHTALRIADFLTRRAGTRNHIIVYEAVVVDVAAMTDRIAEAFPEMAFTVHHLAPDLTEDDLPATDAAFCTLWTSAYHLLRYSRCKAKLYLVQDFEPIFEGGNAVSGLVEQTYRFGFDGVANTPGVAEAYRAYGNRALAFTPAVDRTLYHPGDQDASDGPIKLVFYGRPRNPRNGFELGAQALTRLKARYGDDIEIVSVGGEYEPARFGLDGVVTNLGVLPDMEAVAELYRRSHIGLVFMYSKHPSYQPFEYMASGCATVTNLNEANLWFLRDRENAMLAMPTVTAVADAISELIENQELRRRIVKGGLETVAPLSWETELERILRYVRDGES